MANGQAASSTNSNSNHVYQVNNNQQAAQLAHLTNTLKKKKCVGGHPGPCHHPARTTPPTTDSSVRSDNTTLPETEDTEMLPPSEVVFRAVSPHGHVYWEIDPKRPGRLLAAADNSDSDTNNDMHNMSDFSEEDNAKGGDRNSRPAVGAGSRFGGDIRPLISTTLNPALAGQLQQQQQGRLPEQQHAQQQQQQQHLIQFSPHRFNSLHRPPATVGQDLGGGGFSTRTRLTRHPARGGRTEAEEAGVREQLQQQVQIPDLKRLPVSVKSSEYIMAKIQNHMDQRRGGGVQGGSLREREV